MSGRSGIEEDKKRMAGKIDSLTKRLRKDARILYFVHPKIKLVKLTPSLSEVTQIYAPTVSKFDKIDKLI